MEEFRTGSTLFYTWSRQITLPMFFHSYQEFKVCSALPATPPSTGSPGHTMTRPWKATSCTVLASAPFPPRTPDSTRFQVLLLVSPKPLWYHTGERGNHFFQPQRQQRFCSNRNKKQTPQTYTVQLCLREHVSMLCPRGPALTTPDPATAFRVLHWTPPECLRSKISSRYCPEINYLWWLFCLLTG